MVIILFLKESGSLFIAEVGEITRLSFPFVWLEADKESQNDGSTYSTIPCSIPRPIGISPEEIWAPITVTHSHIGNGFGIRHTRFGLSRPAKESLREQLHV